MLMPAERVPAETALDRGLIWQGVDDAAPASDVLTAERAGPRRAGP